VSKVTTEKPIVIGITGGSGSGKTTLANQLVSDPRIQPASLLSLDSYYRNPEDIPERIGGNYDHPEALDHSLFIEHLRLLRNGLPIPSPCYDFTNHRRRGETRVIRPARIIVAEGVLLGEVISNQDLIDFHVFVDTPADTRLIRRIRRDGIDRGRDLFSILEQYERTVGPMHNRFVEPARNKANLVVDGRFDFTESIDYVVQWISN